MTEPAHNRSQPLTFDPSLLGAALKRRFPLPQDEPFSALLARFDDLEHDEIDHQLSGR